MSQEDTYRPAVLPSEAVMMPATEAVPDAPPPAAQNTLSADDPAMRPAQRPAASLELERLRNRSRLPADVQWISTEQTPIGGAAQVSSPRTFVNTQQEQVAQNRPGTISQGAALQTLMRGAARQHAPAPVLSQATPIPGPISTSQAVSAPVIAQPQMRGALRQAVRNAQQVRPAAPGSEV